jgi:hypothetical protein
MIKITIPNKEHHHKYFFLENPYFHNTNLINQFHILSKKIKASHSKRNHYLLSTRNKGKIELEPKLLTLSSSLLYSLSFAATLPFKITLSHSIFLHNLIFLVLILPTFKIFFHFLCFPKVL